MARTCTIHQGEDILTTALEGGYAEEFEVLTHERHPDDHRIKTADLRDEEGKEYTVTGSTLALGWDMLCRAINDGSIPVGSYLGEQWREGMDEGPEYLDAIGADACLQLATFGEVVYG